MDFIVKLSDTIDDFNGYVEIMQLSDRFDQKTDCLEELVKVENRLVNGLYKMTLHDLIQLLTKSGIGNEIISTPLLPSNCIKHSWVNKAANLQEVIIEVPKARWDITYHTQRFEQVGFPRMLFKYSVAGPDVKLNTVVALKDNGVLKEDTSLFHFPFSHVSSEGHVCMGGNTFPAIKSINQLSTMHVLFLSAPFGDDYGVKSKAGYNMRELLTRLSNHDFDDEWLLDKQLQLLNL